MHINSVSYVIEWFPGFPDKRTATSFQSIHDIKVVGKILSHKREGISLSIDRQANCSCGSSQ